MVERLLTYRRLAARSSRPVSDDFTLDLSQVEFSQNNGYLFFYQPGHPLARKNNGMVAVHRHLMSVFLNRWLTSNDGVLFLNGDTQCQLLFKLTSSSAAILSRADFDATQADPTTVILDGQMVWVVD